MDSAAAKQFFISKVIDEAGLERVPLSDVEKKMLYFTEQHPTLPDILEVAAKFERDYNGDEYEEKISALLRNARDRDKNGSLSHEQQWEDAVDALKKEDHYILVMVYMAFSDYRKAIVPTHRVRDYAIYIAVGIGLVLALVGIAIWRQ